MDKNKIIADWLDFAKDVTCADLCGQDWLESLRARSIDSISSQPNTTDGEITAMPEYRQCINSAQSSRGDRATGFLWGFKACENLMNNGKLKQ